MNELIIVVDVVNLWNDDDEVVDQIDDERDDTAHDAGDAQNVRQTQLFTRFLCTASISWRQNCITKGNYLSKQHEASK